MRARWIALGIVAVVGSSRTASAYSDDALGFSYAVPGGYRQIALASEEQYIVARWQSEREFFDKDSLKEHFYSGFKPEIKVVLFDPKGHFSKEKKDLGDGVSLFTVNNPYKCYKDWVKSEGEGGRYISKEEDTVINAVPTTWYEVAYEKLTVPRHGLAFVYHAEDIDYCITTEVLEQDWKKLSPSLLASFRSFKIFARKGVLKPTVTEGGGSVVAGEDDTPEGRLKRRRDEFDRKLKVCVDRLTPGWTVKWSDSKNYVALSHADAKFTALILDQADGIRAWADDTLAFMGPGIPGPCIIRIFKDWDEQRAFQDVSSHSNGGDGVSVKLGSGMGRINIHFGDYMTEITVSRRDGFWGLGEVAGDVYRRWLQDKNRELSYALPEWIDRGIGEWVSHAFFKGSRLEFRPDVDTMVALKTAAKQGTLIKVRDLLQMTDKALAAADSPGLDDGPTRFHSGAYQQASGLVRYLLAGPGKSNPLTKDLLKVYVTNLDAFLAERKEKETKDAPEAKSKAPKTEEEEEEEYKKGRDYWNDDSREAELLKTVFEKTFGQWKDADWASLEKSYRTFAGN